MTRILVSEGPSRYRRSLWAGVAAGPFFCLLVMLQAATRSGFDFVTMPLSLLALGDGGWIQTFNFLLTGGLIILSSTAITRHPRGGTGLAVAIALYGVGLVSAGLFPSDAVLGFPPGSMPPSTMSHHAMLHGAAFGAAQVSLSAASLIVALRATRQERRWAIFSLGTTLLTPAIVVFGFLHPADMGIAFFGTGAIALAWLGVLSWRFVHGPGV